MNKNLKEMTNTMKTNLYRGRFEERVDLKTGRLVFDHTDFEWDGELSPVSIHHAYNSEFSDLFYTKNYERGLHIADFSAMKLGRGWRLNVMQSMVQRAIPHEDAYYSGFVFTDGTGNQTKFIPFDLVHGLDKFVSVDDESVYYIPDENKIYWGDLVYTFQNERLVEIYDKNSKSSINITYQSGRITEVTDGAGRKFSFVYDDGFLEEIHAPDNQYIHFIYDDTNNLLNEFKLYKSMKNNDGSYSACYPDNDDYIYVDYNTGDTTFKPYKIEFFGNTNMANFVKYYTYDISGALSQIVEAQDCSPDNTYGNIILKEKYSYSSDQKNSLVTVSQLDVDDDDADNSTEDDITFNTHYVFDDDGNIVSKYCALPNGEKVEMTPDTSLANPFASDEATLVPSYQNLLLNHTFNDCSAWVKVPVDGTVFDSSCINTNESNAAYGRNSLILYSEDGATKGKGYSQVVTLTPGTYTFSAFVDVASTFTYTGQEESVIPGVYLLAKKGNTLIDTSANVFEYDTDFVRISSIIYLSTTQEVTLSILQNGAGKAYVSAPQLERNDCENDYNMVENGTVESLSGWSGNGTLLTTDGFSSSPCLKITGSTSANRYIKQTVYPKTSKPTRETFLYSAWVKNFSSSGKSVLRAVINYADGETEEFTKDSVAGALEWQKVELEVEKTRYEGISSIDLYLDYNKQSGSVYADDFVFVRTGVETGLCAEDFPTYAEETEGGVVSDIDESASDFREVKDAHGNSLTETLFEDGCFGTFYRSFMYSDNMNNRIGETDTRGNTTSYAVDSCNSRITSITDRCGNIKEYEYNKDGKVSKVIEKTPEGEEVSTVSLEYDFNGNVVKVTRGDGEEYDFQYNTMGHLVNAAGMVTYTRRANTGRIKSISYANGRIVHLDYDRFGNVVSEIWTKTNSAITKFYSYSYDRGGNLVRTIDYKADKEYNYIYKEGRLVRINTNALIYKSGSTISGRKNLSSIRFTYDKDGNVKKKEYSSTGLRVYYRYSENRDTVLKYLYNNTLSEFHSFTDHLGRRITEEVRTPNKLFWRKFTYLDGEVTPTHEEEGKLVSVPETNLVKKIDFSNGRKIIYDYDAEERITYCDDSYSNPKTYTYDAQGQLSSTTAGGNTTLYKYDGYGNIIARGNALSDGEIADDEDKVTYLYEDTNHRDRLTGYVYNNGTDVITDTFEYDALGNPTKYRTKACEWEKGRELTKYGKYNFDYNSDGIRIAKWYTNSSGTGEVKYDYELEGTKLVKQTRTYTATGEIVEIVPLYDTSDSPIGVILTKPSDTSFAPRTYWYLKNLQGDVLVLQDENGVDVVRYSYNDWGKITVNRDTSGVSLANLNPFRWRSYLYDYETSLYYLNSRYYDPALGRFLNADDVSFLGATGNTAGYNLYAYCENDPVNDSDPTGHVGFKDLWEALKLSLGFIKTIVEQIYKNFNTELTLQEIKKLSRQTGKSQRQIMRELKKFAEHKRRSNKILGRIGKINSVISIILFAIFYLKQGKELFADIYALIVDLFIEIASNFVCLVLEKASQFIPACGFFIGFGVSILVGAILSKYFNSSRRKKITNLYMAKMKKNNDWYDWLFNLITCTFGMA